MKTDQESLQSILAKLRSADRMQQDEAYQFLMAATKEHVGWAYEVWDDLMALIRSGDNRQRAIASQVLCSLAKSDPEIRMQKALRPLLAVTKDGRFVTARHCMQSLWKIGVVSENLTEALTEGLVERFKECASEKNCTLIRYDIPIHPWHPRLASSSRLETPISQR